MPESNCPLLERVARVLAGTELSVNADGDDGHAGPEVDRTWREHLNHAQAVLRTMREPDEAMAAVVAHVFATRPDVDALTADVDPRNERSLRLLEKLGFERTGFAKRTFCLAGEWADSVYLTLKRPV